ncbi:polyprenyl synthetase family protein [Candidatus Liberibacter africanus]|uniref:Probable farnesyl diphosphate synthase n=1 Tax=Candidatus Liberibacter africanus PTSAPSY TaxID=1277257 RepID=A0A0G3I5V4_LIBAF|nr:polyprenyl synthetase family protein [Candidatus Liberibacter africanus]AKK20650.1 geranyltranstransferase protein [Candidatus Liberibacter africanus PTSAPSY]QTP64325.1 polyprenyl synthetase family protein [Candidatus Liberibacter africanus]
MNDDLLSKLQKNSTIIDKILDELLLHTSCHMQTQHNDRLLSAIRYALCGGKKIRAFLVTECASLFKTNYLTALRIGAAIECIHCYSLIHDDLPAMDNGHTRRGKPTVHIQYDEVTAILAGNSLLTYAFEIICSPETQLDDKARSELMLSLTRNIGLQGMIGGQMLDIQDEFIDEKQMFMIQKMKTGKLMGFACEAGAIIANTSQEEKQRLRCFGENLGIIFQLVDDLLDFADDSFKTTKKSSKNATTKNNSCVKIKGKEWVKQEIHRRNKKILEIMDSYKEKSQFLIKLSNYISFAKQ